MKELIEKLIPKYWLAYFGKEGLTSSEANHIANMAKEIAENHTSIVYNMSASLDKVIIEGQEYIVQDREKPSNNDYHQPGKLFSLSAWLRQAVKTRDLVIDRLSSINVDEIDSKNKPIFTMPHPDKSDYAFPKLPKDVDITTPLGDILDIKEYTEYLSLEAQAAHLGKMIHDNGPVDRVRNEILNWKGFSFLEHNGTSYVVKRTQIFTKEEINKIFFKLQEEHREVESRLNWYKAKIRNDAVSINAQRIKDYVAAQNEAQAKYQKDLNAYYSAESEYTAQFNNWSKQTLQQRDEIRKLFSSYRILVPDSLLPQLDYIKQFSHSLKVAD